MPGPNPAGRSQDRLLEPTLETPTKDKGLSLFRSSPMSDSEKRQPNKLRKKRLPGSANPSAHSSTASLSHSGAVSPALEPMNPMDPALAPEEKASTTPENASSPTDRVPNPELVAVENGTSVSTGTPSDATPRASQVPSADVLEAAATQQDGSRATKVKSSPPGSLHSSYNDGGSDMDQLDEPLPTAASEQAELDKKRRWRFSRRKEDITAAASAVAPGGAPAQNLGINSHAETSTSTVGSGGHRARKSWTGDSSDVAATLAESEHGSKEAREEGRGPLGWIKTKYREAKENHEQKRTKSPPGDFGHGFLPTRGKSFDLKRDDDEKRAANAMHEPQTPIVPQNVPLPMSPPPTQTTHEERSKAS